jgi:hypothetical protein
VTPLWIERIKIFDKNLHAIAYLAVKNPKRRSTGVLQDATALNEACEPRASVVECGGTGEKGA